MQLQHLHVQGYRSVRDLHLDLSPVNVLVGPNGTGKSNLYRALTLLGAASEGHLGRAFAHEGGFPSALWAGPRSAKKAARLTIAVEADSVGYELACGVPPPQGMSSFAFDPEVKEERVWIRQAGRKTMMAERKARTAWLRDQEGRRSDHPTEMDSWESILSQVSDPLRYPELTTLRGGFRRWRFYHLFRTDLDSPVRQPQIGVRTMALSHSGEDLAAALQTILELGDGAGLHEAIEAAFPGSRLTIQSTEDMRMSIEMTSPGVRRPLRGHELSDGTLRYLCLLAALKSPRPPSLLAINEPETSLHPELIAPLAQLIVEASYESQMWVTTHSQALAQAIANSTRTDPMELEKIDGETRIVGQGLV